MGQMLTDRGVVFWPVGTGDSTTIVVDEDIVVQVDLRDMAKADDDNTPEIAVVDRLIEALPQRDGRPYLAVFVLTHADKDHCSGFKDLLDQIAIGELWATPRLWRELQEDPEAEMCEDAKEFHTEVERRVSATRVAAKANCTAASGDRVRIIGHDDDGDLHGYTDLPPECLSGPGQVVTQLDNVDCQGRFEAFLHAPFKDDCAKARNDTSVAMQVTLTDGDGVGRFLLLGDLAYETINKIFTYSETAGRGDRLDWDVLLAPHHCSKSVMYLDGDPNQLQQHLLDALERHALTGSTIVSSSAEIPSKDTPSANPPHRLAADRYEEIADEFLCTMEHGSTAEPAPIVFEVASTGLTRLDPGSIAKAAQTEAKATGSTRSRLQQVAAAAVAIGAAAAVASRSGRPRPGQTTKPAPVPGIDRVLERVEQQRGGKKAPTGVVGFGRG
jgi:beta-lactamase superfamily II metal-dependent hydrolase